MGLQREATVGWQQEQRYSVSLNQGVLNFFDYTPLGNSKKHPVHAYLFHASLA